MRARHYAQAIKYLLDTSTTDEGKDHIISQAAKTLIANGHRALAPKVQRILGEMLVTEKRERTIAVSSAAALTEADVSALLKEAPYATLLAGKHKFVERTVDPALIGGTIVRTRGMRVDASQKRALLDLYHHLTQ